MAPPVITVTRQYGSGGSDIARLVAERLEWELVDNQFVEEVARRAGVPPDQAAQRGGPAPGRAGRGPQSGRRPRRAPPTGGGKRRSGRGGGGGGVGGGGGAGGGGGGGAGGEVVHSGFARLRPPPRR